MKKYKVLLAVFVIVALSLAASKVAKACGDEYEPEKDIPEEIVDTPDDTEEDEVDEPETPSEDTQETVVEEPSDELAEEISENQEPEQPVIVPEEPVVVPEVQVVKDEQPVQIVYQVVNSDNNDEDDEDEEDKEDDDDNDEEELAALKELPKTGNPALGSILGSFMIGLGTLLRKKK